MSTKKDKSLDPVSPWTEQLDEDLAGYGGLPGFGEQPAWENTQLDKDMGGYGGLPGFDPAPQPAPVVPASRPVAPSYTETDIPVEEPVAEEPPPRSRVDILKDRYQKAMLMQGLQAAMAKAATPVTENKPVAQGGFTDLAKAELAEAVRKQGLKKPKSHAEKLKELEKELNLRGMISSKYRAKGSGGKTLAQLEKELILRAKYRAPNKRLSTTQDADGNPIVEIVDLNTGETELIGKRGYKPTLTKGTHSGESIVFKPGTTKADELNVKPGSVTKYADLSPTQRVKFKEYKTRMDADAQFSGLRDRELTYQKIRGLIAEAKSDPSKSGLLTPAINNMARTIGGEKGVMTDKDFERASGIPMEWWKQGHDFVQKQLGNLPETHQIKAIEAMLKRTSGIEAKAYKNMKNAYMQDAKAMGFPTETLFRPETKKTGKSKVQTELEKNRAAQAKLLKELENGE